MLETTALILMTSANPLRSTNTILHVIFGSYLLKRFRLQLVLIQSYYHLARLIIKEINYSALIEFLKKGCVFFPKIFNRTSKNTLICPLEANGETTKFLKENIESEIQNRVSYDQISIKTKCK